MQLVYDEPSVRSNAWFRGAKHPKARINIHSDLTGKYVKHLFKLINVVYRKLTNALQLTVNRTLKKAY
jgi:hypothetical protein